MTPAAQGAYAFGYGKSLEGGIDLDCNISDPALARMFAH
jgi:hypothetical protein